MKKLLVVIDMQNDFITGTLGSKQAQNIVPLVADKILLAKKEGYQVIFTKDSHDKDYLTTQEGHRLPVVHCIKGTHGHQIIEQLDISNGIIIEKDSFGSLKLPQIIAEQFSEYEEIQLCGVCTDICVVSNALILKANFPEVKITVDANLCAGVSKESHQAALLTMKMCQIEVLND